jgi:hypothetical protein
MVAVTSHSLASQLPQGQWVYAVFVSYRNYCGSWLASDEALTFNINVA